MSLKNSFRNLAVIVTLVLCFISGDASAQIAPPEQRAPNMRLPDLHFPAGKSSVEVPFEVVRNLMVIPVSINGSRPLRFVLDTGAQGTFLQNAEIADSLNLKIVGKVAVRGVGSGPRREASRAEGVNFNIGGIELSNGDLVVFPPPPGPQYMSDHDGAIGRMVFATLVVEVDWEKRVIRFYDPSKYKYTGTGAVLPLTFDEGGRPYTIASVAVTGEKSVPVKLVVDTGASHALSLDVGSNPEIKLPEGAVKAVLGRGASGEVTGYTGRSKRLQIGGQMLENVPTTFPDAASGMPGAGGRQGNLGAGVLRRFKVIYDYSRQRMIVEPNKFFSEPFAVAPVAAANITATNKMVVPPAILQEYVGRYGERTISFEDGALYLQRQGGPKLRLVFVSKDEFTLEMVPAARIKFIRDESGKITELNVLNMEGEWEKSKREQP
jgi:predicted aspartyl protease